MTGASALSCRVPSMTVFGPQAARRKAVARTARILTVFIRGKDGIGDGLHLFGGQGKLGLPEVHVGFGLQGDEVDVRVRDFHPEDGDAHPLARDGLADGDGDLAGELRQALVGLFVQMEDVVSG